MRPMQLPPAPRWTHTTSFEQVAEAAERPFWLQSYMWENRELSYGIMARARAAGAEVLLPPHGYTPRVRSHE